MNNIDSNILEEKFGGVLDSAKDFKLNEPKTFFQIAGFRHHETVISNFYGYFLDAKEEHGLGSLFLNSLLEILSAKGVADFPEFNDPKVFKEYFTDKGNYIDIVIKDQVSSQDATNAIIIENKVFALDYNDFEDYHQSVRVSGNKVGIFLTLEKMKAKHPSFLNVTHSEWLEKVRTGAAQLSLTSRQKFILEDFTNNLKSLIFTPAMENAIKFCFEKGPEIGQLLLLQKEVENTLVQNIKLASADFGYNKVSIYKGFVSIDLGSTGAFLYFNYENLFTEKYFTISVWLAGPCINKWKSLESIGAIKNEFPNLIWKSQAATGFLKVAEKTYHGLVAEQICEFRTFATELIDKDFKPAIDRIVAEVKED